MFEYKNKIKTFNDDQILGANNFNGPLLILAGPGSGKSTVLKIRTSLMIQGEKITKDKDNNNILVQTKQKIDPSNILMVTFTNKAANELAIDMCKYLNEDISSKINIGTFHSLGMRILKENYVEFGISSKLKIIEGEEQQKIIKLVNYYSSLNPGEILSLIGLWKNELLVDVLGYSKLHQRYQDDLNLKNVVLVYQKYEEYKQKHNLWDSDDLISRTITFLTNPKFKHIKEKYQELFKYIMLDEYQDTNASQYKFSMLLKNLDNNICVVGDPDQSIYEWRGADMRIIKTFTTDFKDAKQVLLLQNYRSQKTIIETADFILQNNNIDKKPRGSLQMGHIINRSCENINVVCCENEQDEARYVLRQIRKLNKMGIKHSSVAIFGRSISHVSKIEEMINLDNSAFKTNKLAYNISSKASFYNNKDIKFIWNLMLLSLNPHQNSAMIIVLKMLKFSSSDLEKIEKISILNNVSIFSILYNIKRYYNLENDIRFELIVNEICKLIRFGAKTSVSLKQIISKIKQTILNVKLVEYQELFKYYNFIINFDNIKLLENFINRLEKLEPEHELYLDKFNFINKHEQVTCYSVDYVPGDECLNLMTMHASKGLEFEVVFCVGLNEGKFPSNKKASINDFEADRRLAFVAYTRAKQKLYLTYTKYISNFGIKQEVIKSRYISEIFEEVKQVNSDLNYQKIMSDFVNDCKNSRIANIINFSSLPDLSWQNNLKNGDVVHHLKLKKDGVVVSLDEKYITINFNNQILKIFKHNVSLINKGVK